MAHVLRSISSSASRAAHGLHHRSSRRMAAAASMQSALSSLVVPWVWGKMMTGESRRAFSSPSGVSASTAMVVNSVEPEQVNLSLPHGQATVFHAVWLWYNSPQHLDPDSGQRILEPWQLRRVPRVAAAAVSSGGASLVVHWTDGTQSEYPTQWLIDNNYSLRAVSAARAAATPLTLGACTPARVVEGRRAIRKDQVPSFDYSEVLHSDVALHAWLRALNEYGIALVKNAPTEPGTVLQVASRISEPMWTIYGNVWDVAVMPHPINIAYAPVMLDMHVDLVYYESPPGLQLLHCRRFDAGVVGGESTFMDGFHVAEELRRRDPVSFETLTRVPATFQKVHYNREKPAHIVAQRPHITVDRSIVGEANPPITGIFWAPPFEGPLRVPADDVIPYFKAYQAFAELMRELEEEGSHLVEYRMETGDISVFNNRRVLHGRRHFHAADGVADAQRVLQGCYVNIDEFKSRYVHLCGAHGDRSAVKRVANQNAL